MRLDQASQAFLSHCECERRLAQLTIEAYGADLHDFARHLGAATSMEAVGVDALKGYLVVLNSGRALSVATVRRRFATLQGLFKWSASNHGITNPFLTWAPKIKRPKRLPRALHRLELSSLMDTAERRAQSSKTSDVTFLALALMAATGMRVGEMSALTLEDVAPDATIIRLKGKGARDRVVYVSNSWLLEKLGAWRRDRAAYATGADPFFICRKGGRLNPPAFRARIKRVARAGGATRKITPHMLRHTAATLLIEEGVDIRLVQRLLGHASIATTEIYTHVADEALRKSLAQADIIGRVAPRPRR